MRMIAACFICLKSSNLEKCLKCGEFMCARHKRVHYGDDGRILVATRKVKKGELIFSEVPAVVGPYSRTGPQCLQCFRLFSRGAEQFLCPGCGFPVCGMECSRGKYHAEECYILARAAVTITDMEGLNTNYSAITVLRLLLLLEREREAEAQGGYVEGEDYLLCLADSLLHHNEERKLAQPEVWQFEEELMVQFLQQKCHLGERFSSQEIHAANGRIMMNATSLELPEDGYGRGAGLFPVYSMMNTSCRNNTKSTVMADHRVQIRAKTRIMPGEEITNEYLRPETSTLLRRPLIKDKWFFHCSCPRCRDPTELGSHYGSLLCSRRRCGGTVLSTDSMNNESDWSCEECDERLPARSVREILDESQLFTNSCHLSEGVIDHYENIIFNLSDKLHPGNFLLMEIKQKLGLLYGNIFPYTINRLSRPARERKAQLCQEALTSLSRVESGLSEWQIALMTELAKMKDPAYLQDNPDPDGRRGMMAKFLLQDGMLSLTNCLQLCQK